MSPTRRRVFAVSLLALGAVAAPVALAGGFRHGDCHGWSENATVEEVRAHLTSGADRALDRVDATDAQREAVVAALDGLAPSLLAWRDEGRALRAEAREALLAPQVDGGRIEEIRRDAIELADEASAGVVATVVTIAQTLDAEQRNELGELAKRFHRE